MSSNLSKITSALLFVILGITVILLIVFVKATSGIPAETDFATQIKSYGSILDLFLFWAYALFVIAALIAFIFPVIQLFANPKAAVKTFITFAILAVIIVVAYAMADDAVLKLPGYTGTGNVPGTLKFAGTLLYTTYILLIGTIVSILYVEIAKAFK